MSEEIKYEGHIKWARTQLKLNNDSYHSNKGKTIKSLAKKLEDDGMKAEDICGYITEKLEGYAVGSYIRRVLDDKYKEKKQQERASQQQKETEEPPQIATTGETINENRANPAPQVAPVPSSIPTDIGTDDDEVGEAEIETGPSTEDLVAAAVNQFRKQIDDEMRAKDEEIASLQRKAANLEKELTTKPQIPVGQKSIIGRNFIIKGEKQIKTFYGMCQLWQKYKNDGIEKGFEVVYDGAKFVKIISFNVEED